MKARELDLYDGVVTPADTRAGERAPASRPGPPEDWIALVWREFPEAVRARYRAIGLAGEGGMGVVLEAHDELLDRRVAIKGPRDPAACTDAWRQRLAREGRIHARLAHPNILPPRSGSRRRSRRRSRRPTTAACCTATSSPRTC